MVERKVERLTRSKRPAPLDLGDERGQPLQPVCSGLTSGLRYVIDQLVRNHHQWVGSIRSFPNLRIVTCAGW